MKGSLPVFFDPAVQILGLYHMDVLTSLSKKVYVIYCYTAHSINILETT